MKEEGKKRASQWVKGLYARLGAIQLHLPHRNLCIIQKMPQTALLGKLCVCACGYVCLWRYRLQRSYQVLKASNLFNKTQSICLGALETKCWQTDTLGATVRQTHGQVFLPICLIHIMLRHYIRATAVVKSVRGAWVFLKGIGWSEIECLIQWRRWSPFWILSLS